MRSKVALLAHAKKMIGIKGRPNTFTRWYASRHGKQFLKAAWCDMFASWVGMDTGLGKVTGEFALCSAHVAWFKKNGRWGSKPKVGAYVFYDWDGDGLADHVGIVESSSGKKIVAIEGNRNDQVQRVGRSAGMLGYGYPRYPDDDIPEIYVVQRGDSLTAIAFRFYGDYAKWRAIYKANRAAIGKDPGLIRPGLKLRLPRA